LFKKRVKKLLRDSLFLNFAPVDIYAGEAYLRRDRLSRRRVFGQGSAMVVVIMAGAKGQEDE
jgi:hypothetical protein